LLAQKFIAHEDTKGTKGHKEIRVRSFKFIVFSCKEIFCNLVSFVSHQGEGQEKTQLSSFTHYRYKEKKAGGNAYRARRHERHEGAQRDKSS